MGLIKGVSGVVHTRRRLSQTPVSYIHPHTHQGGLRSPHVRTFILTQTKAALEAPRQSIQSSSHTHGGFRKTSVNGGGGHVRHSPGRIFQYLFFVEIIVVPKMESLFRGVHVNTFKIGIG